MAGAVVTVVVGVRHVRTGGAARSDDVVRRISRAHAGLGFDWETGVSDREQSPVY
jgi:hypothetical protein